MNTPSRRIAIIFDGSNWFVRRIRVIEHDTDRDEMVYHCDKPLGNDYRSLAEIPQVKHLLNKQAVAQLDNTLDALDASR